MFIKDSVCISPQETFPSAFKGGPLREHTGNKYFATEPSYEGLIHTGSLRRMGKAVRMGVAAGTQLLKRAPEADGIIIGTANGGLEDCIKFLNQIVDYGEGTLTPTNFVQSTPNAIGGQLALIHGNTGYNITHAHGGLSFENALTDAGLLFEQNEACRLLVGSVEEISDYNHNIDQLSGLFKKETTSSSSLLRSATPGTVNGEGAVMFSLEKDASEPGQVRISAVTSISYASPGQVRQHLLDMPGASGSGVDALMLGYNGDPGAASWYDLIRENFSAGTPVFSFKNACGEYPTASAFAVWLAHQILAGRSVPGQLLVSGDAHRKIKKILIYNHYREDHHSFILLDVLDPLS